MIDYDKDIFGEVDDLDVDIKLNPDFYIHNAILSAQKSILLSTMEGKTTDGINAYMIFINQIKIISKSAGYLKDSTAQEKIKSLETNIKSSKDIKERLEYTSEMFETILEELFDNKIRRGSMVMDSKKKSVGTTYELGLRSKEDDNNTTT